MKKKLFATDNLYLMALCALLKLQNDFIVMLFTKLFLDNRTIDY
ncbi:MAG TPA: hypothetical protein P5268_01135 [Candidatus Marinimicrobia bacterium]|nr:hypothetical protein [Candidatus Neomarinimicrobiota bacterium]HRU91617.1 hypothetical protein [Candidatus Neomarinimicrobiota bacterium]